MGNNQEQTSKSRINPWKNPSKPNLFMCVSLFIIYKSNFVSITSSNKHVYTYYINMCVCVIIYLYIYTYIYICRYKDMCVRMCAFIIYIYMYMYLLINMYMYLLFIYAHSSLTVCPSKKRVLCNKWCLAAFGPSMGFPCCQVPSVGTACTLDLGPCPRWKCVDLTMKFHGGFWDRNWASKMATKQHETREFKPQTYGSYGYLVSIDVDFRNQTWNWCGF